MKTGTRHLIRFNRRLASLFVLLLIFTLAQAERRERLIDTWRPLHFDVKLALDDQLTEITRAETKIKIQVLKNSVGIIDLDFGEMTIDFVRVGDAPAQYQRTPGKLLVTLPHNARRNDQLSITITYHGRPADGLILMKDKDGRPSATGDNWPDRVHHWIPCLDHPSAKATVAYTVTAPTRDLVVANGKFIATTTNSDSMLTWTYDERVPIPVYCMVIAVGEFAKLAPLENALTPLSYYVPQSDSRYAVQGFAPAVPTLSFFQETVGPYPYEKLALIVGATRFGGMENSSAIVFSSNLFTPRTDQPISPRFQIRRGIMEVTAHEIAHQWFGDSVTEATWSDLWLSEGFATYFAGLFVEKFEGRAAFREYMKRQTDDYLRYVRERRTPIHDRETVDLFKLLNANNYDKGAWVLHMLRNLMGDEAFFRGIRNYYKSHREGTATTEDLRAALERSSGMNLKDFFTRWIYMSGHPQYEASWRWQPISGAKGVLVITLRQTQPDAPFLIPLPIEIVTANGIKRERIRPTGKTTIMRLPLKSRPSAVNFDPDETVLKELVVRT